MGHKVQIAGIGSPFGDDTIGWQVVDLLQSSDSLKPYQSQLSFTQMDRPGAGLVAYLESGLPTVLIDAMCSGVQPGALKTWRGGEVGQAHGLLSSHGFGVRDAISLAESLGVLPEYLLVIGIEVDTKNNDDSQIPMGEIEKVLVDWLAPIM